MHGKVVQHFNVLQCNIEHGAFSQEYVKGYCFDIFHAIFIVHVTSLFNQLESSFAELLVTQL